MTYHLTHISKWASILNDTICIDDWEQQNFLWKLEISEEHYWFKSNILLFKLGFFYITYLQASFNIHYISGSYHIKFNLYRFAGTKFHRMFEYAVICKFCKLVCQCSLMKGYPGNPHILLLRNKYMYIYNDSEYAM